MRTPHAVTCTIVVCCALRAATTRADPPPPPTDAVIDWDAPAGCPTAADVRASIRSLVGGSSAPGRLGAVSMRGTVSQTTPSSFTLTVRVDDAGTSEVRIIAAETCTALADAYTVIAAYAIDPGAATSVDTAAPLTAAHGASSASGATTPAAPGGSTSSGATTLAPPRSPPAVMTATPPPGATPAVPPAVPGGRPRPIASPQPAGVASVGANVAPTHVPTRVAAGAFVAFGAGQLPFPAYGFGAALGLEHGMRWELSGAYWPPDLHSTFVGATGKVGARVQLAAGRASGCLPFAQRAAAFCGGADVGAMQARGDGVPNTNLGSSWWVAPVAALELRLRTGQTFALALRLEGGVSLLRPHFVLQNVGGDASVEAYRPAPVFAAIAIQPEIELFSTDRSPAPHVHP